MKFHLKRVYGQRILPKNYRKILQQDLSPFIFRLISRYILKEKILPSRGLSSCALLQNFLILPSYITLIKRYLKIYLWNVKFISVNKLLIFLQVNFQVFFLSVLYILLYLLYIVPRYNWRANLTRVSRPRRKMVQLNVTTTSKHYIRRPVRVT